MSDIFEHDIPNEEAEEEESSGYHTLVNGYLSPRHRRLCLLAAQGQSNKKIAEELDYVDSRVSILLRNPYIQAEIERIRERIYEETISSRLKTFAEPALDNIQKILTDKTNRVKVSEKAEMSKWVIEKLDGKAIQKHDVGENMLGIFMDKLDSLGAAGRTVIPTTPSAPDIEVKALPEAPKERSRAEILEAWADDFMSQE